MQTLNEHLKTLGLAKYIRFNKENEQFKLYLKQPYQDLVVWKDNPNESSVITISIHSNPKHVEKQLTNPRSQGCPRFQSGEELANSVGKINAC